MRATAPRPRSTPIHGLLARIAHDILTDRANLPSMPNVALSIRRSMRQPDCSAASVARAIKSDPGTTAYLVRIANSALYRGAAAIEGVENAVVRLGLETTRNLVTAYALRAMFRTKSEAVNQVMQTTWRASALRAALSSVIATHCRAGDPDRAMLAGLLQDIGILPLLRAVDARGLQPDIAQLENTLGAFAGKVGVMLLENWGFEEDMIEVARSRKDWCRDPGPNADLADIVLIARLHAGVGTPEMHEAPRINAVPAYGKLPLGDVGPDESLAFLREADAEVRELMQILGVTQRSAR